MERVKSSIMLRCQIGLQLWKIWILTDIISAWKTIRENTNISAKEGLGSLIEEA
jgi:hypothetical protein